MSEPRLLSYDKAAEYMDVSRSTIEKLVRDGRLESTRLEGTILRRISVEALDVYLRPVESGEVVELRRHGGQY
jgi:excisionase family DNA binding protein